MKWQELEHIEKGKRLTPKEQDRVKDAMIEQLIASSTFSCPLCHRSFDDLERKNREQELKGKRYTSPIALDHDHVTGFLRGLLCTSCNRAEGIIADAVKTWGQTHRDGITQYLRNLIEYLESEPHVYLHKAHRTSDEKKAIAKKRRQKKAKEKAKNQ